MRAFLAVPFLLVGALCALMGFAVGGEENAEDFCRWIEKGIIKLGSKL
jgi:hypothetical protein